MPENAARRARTGDENRYQWLTDYQPDSPSYSMGEGQLLPLVVTEAVFAIVLSLPLVTRQTGVDAVTACAIVAAHTLSVIVVAYGLSGWRARSRVGFHVSVQLTVLAGIGAACAFPVLGKGSLLWSLPVVYAAYNGSMAETRPSRVLLLLHLAGPLVAHFLVADAPLQDLADPVVSSVLSGGSYHFLALRGGAWRALSARHARARELLREQEEELSRMRLVRELHDGVGSALGLLALHASLLERHKDDPEQVVRLAALARDAARGGLDDLRGVLEAVAPEESTLNSVAQALEELARRTAPDVVVEVTVVAGAKKTLSAGQRLAVVRTFQESLRNAVLHGEARRVRALLGAEHGLMLEVQDDGAGFDLERVRRGRGLAGMQGRAKELGGVLEVTTGEGAGTTVKLLVPHPGLEQAS